MFHVWVGTWIAGMTVFVFTLILILYAPIRYRRKHPDDPAPPQIRYNLPIEAFYTVVPIVIVGVLFYHNTVAQNDILKKVKNPDNVVQVVGSKWQWTFNYVDPTATGGETVYDQGDTDHLPDLYLPIGESVEFKLTSPDVIHSFWVPEFYFKMDVFPGHVNKFTMTPTRKGVYRGRCAELCGTYHSRMLFDVHIVSKSEYEAHLRSLQKAGQTGLAAGQENTVAGLDRKDK